MTNSFKRTNSETNNSNKFSDRRKGKKDEHLSSMVLLKKLGT